MNLRDLYFINKDKFCREGMLVYLPIKKIHDGRTVFLLPDNGKGEEVYLSPGDVISCGHFPESVPTDGPVRTTSTRLLNESGTEISASQFIVVENNETSGPYINVHLQSQSLHPTRIVWENRLHRDDCHVLEQEQIRCEVRNARRFIQLPRLSIKPGYYSVSVAFTNNHLLKLTLIQFFPAVFEQNLYFSRVPVRRHLTLEKFFPISREPGWNPITSENHAMLNLALELVDLYHSYRTRSYVQELFQTYFIGISELQTGKLVDQAAKASLEICRLRDRLSPAEIVKTVMDEHPWADKDVILVLIQGKESRYEPLSVLRNHLAAAKLGKAKTFACFDIIDIK